MFVKLFVNNKGVATYVRYWKLLGMFVKLFVNNKGWLRM